VTEFTPLAAAIGGFLIGLSAVIAMAFNGKITGMTRISSGVIPPLASDWPWRAAFLAGAIGAPAIVIAATGQRFDFDVPVSTAVMIGGGLIVGAGVAYSSGCTSGHGVCGLARFSRRSLAATATFMATAFVTVFVVRHVLGA
jgi:uncharacterized membrane protein YedE/YeeE